MHAPIPRIIGPADSFKVFLRQFAQESSAIGDLARDVRADRSFPTAMELEPLTAYMESVGASEAAIRTLHHAWQMWTLARWKVRQVVP